MPDTPLFEVELRGLVNEAAVAGLRAYCDQHGQYLGLDKRFLVDYSTFLEGVENRTKDIRIRSTNGRREIIAKLGSFAAASRQEAGVYIHEATSLRQLMTTMAFMGYEKGVAALRYIHRYKLGEAEVALQEVRSYANPENIDSFFVEVEIMARSEEKEGAEAKIRHIFTDLGIEPMDSRAWYAYVERLNKEANGIFDYKDPDWNLIESIDA